MDNNNQNEGEKSAPVSPENRQLSYDVLRGFAILGILAVNIMSMRGVDFWRALFQITEPFQWKAEEVLRIGITFFVEGKMYPILAILFGVGFWMIFHRLSEKGVRPYSPMLKRLGILFLLGVFHGIFIWAGDILTFYAVSALILFLFVKWSAEKMLKLAIILYVVTGIVLVGVFGGLIAVGNALEAWADDPEIKELIQEMEEVEGVEKERSDEGSESEEVLEDEKYQEMIEEAFDYVEEVYQSGSFWEITLIRAIEFFIYLVLSFLIFPLHLAFLLTGMYFAASSFLVTPLKRSNAILKIMVIALPLAVIANGARVAIQISTSGDYNSAIIYILDMMSYLLGDLAFTLFYISLLVLLLNQATTAILVKWLAPVGRMALTNYLMQSVVVTLIFYSYGGGWFGKMNHGTSYLIVLGVWGFQIIGSHIWLNFFRYGPLEWIWRGLAYGKRPRMIKNSL